MRRKVFDTIRNSWVAATPEEIVRQTWISRMVGSLQFPKELIAVERQLRTLPSGQESVPDRRIDILCFMHDKGEIKPLLLIECKAQMISEKALDQVVAYNTYVQAPYVAVVNLEGAFMLSAAQMRTYLPPFPILLEELHG